MASTIIVKEDTPEEFLRDRAEWDFQIKNSIFLQKSRSF